MEERRQNTRSDTPENVVVLNQLSTIGYGDLVNISVGGTKIRTHDRIDLGDISLMFKLPPAKQPLKAQGKVVWHKEKGGVYEMGVKVHEKEVRYKKIVQRFQEQFWNVR